MRDDDNRSNSTTFYDPADYFIEMMEAGNKFEKLAYDALIEEGVPLCYTFTPESPPSDISRVFTGGAAYWANIMPPEGIPLPLDRQLDDWKIFCKRKHASTSNVAETQLQKWQRYLDWHLNKHKIFEKTLQKDLIKIPDCPRKTIYIEKKRINIDLHQICLVWIAEQRDSMQMAGIRRSSRLAVRPSPCITNSSPFRISKAKRRERVLHPSGHTIRRATISQKKVDVTLKKLLHETNHTSPLKSTRLNSTTRSGRLSLKPNWYVP